MNNSYSKQQNLLKLKTSMPYTALYILIKDTQIIRMPNHSPQGQDKELLDMFNETDTDSHKEILQRLEDAEKRIDDMEKTITMLFTMIREIGDFQVKNEKPEPPL